MTNEEKDITRTELAYNMLCAWSNVSPDKAPPEWWQHPSDNNRQAWERVAQAALDYLNISDYILFHSMRMKK